MCVSTSAFPNIIHIFLSFLERITSTALLSRQHESLIIKSFNQHPSKLPDLVLPPLPVRGCEGLSVLDPPKSTPPILSSLPNECIWYNLELSTSSLFSFYTTDLVLFRSFPRGETCLFSLFTAEFPEFWILLRLQLAQHFYPFKY